MTNTNADPRHSISSCICVAFAISSLLSQYISQVSLLACPHWLQYTNTDALFFNARYKLVPPLTLSRQYLTRPAHLILANPHCLPVPFRPLDTTPLCYCVYLICTRLVIQFETWKFLSHTCGYQCGEHVQTPKFQLNRGYEEIPTLRSSSTLNNAPAKLLCEPNAVITHSGVTSDVHHLSPVIDNGNFYLKFSWFTELDDNLNSSKDHLSLIY